MRTQNIFQPTVKNARKKKFAMNIAALDEYGADDGDAPQWRLDKHIGTSIH